MTHAGLGLFSVPIRNIPPHPSSLPFNAETHHQGRSRSTSDIVMVIPKISLALLSTLLAFTGAQGVTKGESIYRYIYVVCIYAATHIISRSCLFLGFV